jgi:hypothetical protein
LKASARGGLALGGGLAWLPIVEAAEEATEAGASVLVDGRGAGPADSPQEVAARLKSAVAPNPRADLVRTRKA